MRIESDFVANNCYDVSMGLDENSRSNVMSMSEGVDITLKGLGGIERRACTPSRDSRTPRRRP